MVSWPSWSVTASRARSALSTSVLRASVSFCTSSFRLAREFCAFSYSTGEMSFASSSFFSLSTSISWFFSASAEAGPSDCRTLACASAAFTLIDFALDRFVRGFHQHLVRSSPRRPP